MVNALGPWGVSPGAEDLYRVLLRSPGVLEADLPKMALRSEEEIAGFLVELDGVGLVRREADGQLTAMPPSQAIESLVSRELQLLDGRIHELGEAKSALSRYAADYRPRSDGTPLAEIVSWSDTTDVLLGLVHQADGPIRTIYLTLEPAWEERQKLLAEAFSVDKEFNVLVPIEYLNNERIITDLRSLIRPGVELRFVARTVTSLSVYGSMAASTLTNPYDYHSDRLVMRTPALISIFNDYFSTLWRIAIPLNHQPDHDADRVLMLLAQGFKDEAIASQLNMSLRTVRRRIAELMESLGADSRFQAGVEAVRRGLL